MSEYEENVKLNRERHALVEKDKREEFIDKLIMPALPDYKKAFARPRVSDIVDKFIGRDMDTLSVLQYAAENKRFDEFMDKLEEHYYNNIRCV
ncbi:MAG: hypothetical protein KKA43_04660, partial [Nanoarchaeota archaeon]|nr:hypothetical protein [Nanoarchaeota archaeon]